MLYTGISPQFFSAVFYYIFSTSFLASKTPIWCKSEFEIITGGKQILLPSSTAIYHQGLTLVPERYSSLNKSTENLAFSLSRFLMEVYHQYAKKAIVKKA